MVTKSEGGTCKVENLCYGRVLTDVFLYFGVDLEGEEYLGANVIDFNQDSLKKMTLDMSGVSPDEAEWEQPIEVEGHLGDGAGGVGGGVKGAGGGAGGANGGVDGGDGDVRPLNP
ncbi:glycine-rich RNA-binding protein 2, mitochondrial-like [Macadamia integrifolia]|uniref:glycine-rich RNA-binding protein 2, mitochondrial-like n=1 Tax=Macadamia integrifolia TaxID=60698 RepID=UPI001C52FBA9|nr:glycine-rich RNA-binding protein 2, mitochondrial-like [Macadamia integrifolia]